MTSLEIRAIAYAAVAALLVALGVRLGMHHVQAQWNIDKLAQAAALSTAQQNLAAALADRVQLQQQVAQQNATLQANANALVGSVSDSVRNINAALRAGAVRPAVADSGASKGTPASPGSGSELAAAVASLGDAITATSAACLHDSRELELIQESAPKP